MGFPKVVEQKSGAVEAREVPFLEELGVRSTSVVTHNYSVRCGQLAPARCKGQSS